MVKEEGGVDVDAVADRWGDVGGHGLAREDGGYGLVEEVHGELMGGCMG